MRVQLDNKAVVPVGDLSFDQLRKFLQQVINENPHSGALWDVLTCLRGPDSPSERSDMSSSAASKAYAGRRERKYRTVEIIRSAAFFGTIGGAARSHAADKVILPPSKMWDHFDKHVARAASRLGLKVETKEDLVENDKG